MRLFLYALSFCFVIPTISVFSLGISFLFSDEPHKLVGSAVAFGISIVLGFVVFVLIIWGRRIGETDGSAQEPRISDEESLKEAGMWGVENLDLGALRPAGCLLFFASLLFASLPLPILLLVSAAFPGFAEKVMEQQFLEHVGTHLLAAFCMAIFAFSFYFGHRFLSSHGIATIGKKRGF